MAARAALAMATRQATTLSRLPSPTPVFQATKLIPRRGLAGGGDHHGPPRVNFWEDPRSPSKWKEEHFVIVSWTGWGLLFYGGYRLATGGKKENNGAVVAESPQ